VCRSTTRHQSLTDMHHVSRLRRKGGRRRRSGRQRSSYLRTEARSRPSASAASRTGRAQHLEAGVPMQSRASSVAAVRRSRQLMAQMRTPAHLQVSRRRRLHSHLVALAMASSSRSAAGCMQMWRLSSKASSSRSRARSHLCRTAATLFQMVARALHRLLCTRRVSVVWQESKTNFILGRCPHTSASEGFQLSCSIR